MSLTVDHRRLVLGQALGGAVINLFLNGWLAWATFPPVETLPLWARGNCVAGDTLGTSFFLPLITCIILTLVTRKVVRGGSIPWIPRAELPTVSRILPNNFIGRGALVGLACALTVGLATLGLLTALGVDAMTRSQVTTYKAVYTVLLGLLVTPLFAWRAFADGPTPTPPEGSRSAPGSETMRP